MGRCFGRFWILVASAILFVLPITAHAWGRAGSAERKAARELDARIKADAHALDTLVSDALASGKTLLVMPVIDVIGRPRPSGDSEGGASPMHTYDWSNTTRWINAADSSKSIRTGLLDPDDRQKLRGTRIGENGATEFVPLYRQFWKIGKQSYQLYIVEPGTYYLDSNDALMRRTVLPIVDRSARKTHASVIGMLELQERPHQEFEKYLRWENRQYRTDYRVDSYCSAVRVVNGQCVSYRQVETPVQAIAREAGYYDANRMIEAPSLEIHSVLKTPFAQFTVKPGEVALVDGFFADYPNAEIEVAGCTTIRQNALRCPITSYAMTRLSASLESLIALASATDEETSRYPRINAAMRNAKNIPLDLAAQSNDESVNQGILYRQTSASARSVRP